MGDCSEIGELYHILGIGLKKMVELPDGVSAQKVINMIRVQQGITIIAHPYWSGLTFSDVLPLKEILGIEVFNARCHNDIGKGFSAVH
jgi:predicted metal-dependent phosphoesterase TrpH